MSGSPAKAEGTNCICRLNPIANFGSYFLYRGERRATCKTPDGHGNCSTPSLVYLADTPGLPPQDCFLGQCVPNSYPAMVSSNEGAATAPGTLWAISAPYPAGFSLNTISNSNPAYYAVFPQGDRPPEAVVQDFTLQGVVDGRDAHVRAMKVNISLGFRSVGGVARVRTVAVACGMEFTDVDSSNNAVLQTGATMAAANGQPYCRKFVHLFPGDTTPTEVVVLLVASGVDEK